MWKSSSVLDNDLRPRVQHTLHVGFKGSKQMNVHNEECLIVVKR